MGTLMDYCRTLVHAGNECYISGGSCGQSAIASGRVTMPSDCGKAVVVLPTGSSDASRTQVIAVNTPENNSLDST